MSSNLPSVGMRRVDAHRAGALSAIAAFRGVGGEGCRKAVAHPPIRAPQAAGVEKPGCRPVDGRSCSRRAEDPGRNCAARSTAYGHLRAIGPAVSGCRDRTMPCGAPARGSVVTTRECVAGETTSQLFGAIAAAREWRPPPPPIGARPDVCDRGRRVHRLSTARNQPLDECVERKLAHSLKFACRGSPPRRRNRST